jgi:hypothetical protein
MEAMLGISLYNYLCLKLAKMLVFLIVSYVFSPTKSEQVPPGKRWERCEEGEGSPYNVYTHINKCKNDKIKKERKNGGVTVL